MQVRTPVGIWFLPGKSFGDDSLIEIEDNYRKTLKNVNKEFKLKNRFEMEN